MGKISSNQYDKQKNILISGAAGMLGSALIPQLTKMNCKVYATDINTENHYIEYLDVRDFPSVKSCFTTIRPFVVYHLAAETDLEKCETNPDHAYETNTLGTQNVCIAAKNTGATVVYISTAGVFDGSKLEPYTEFDKVNPINTYGKSKYQGEKIVESLMMKYFIVRAGWMIGGGIKDKKFVAKIMKQLNNGIKKLYIVNDKFGTPTYVVDFAMFLSFLSQTEYYGLYHAACTGVGSRLDVAAKILQYLNRTDVDLVPVSSEYFIKTYPTPRGLDRKCCKII